MYMHLRRKFPPNVLHLTCLLNHRVCSGAVCSRSAVMRYKPITVIGCIGCIWYIQYLLTTVGGRDRVSRIRL